MAALIIGSFWVWSKYDCVYFGGGMELILFLVPQNHILQICSWMGNQCRSTLKPFHRFTRSLKAFTLSTENSFYVHNGTLCSHSSAMKTLSDCLLLPFKLFVWLDFGTLDRYSSQRFLVEQLYFFQSLCLHLSWKYLHTEARVCLVCATVGEFVWARQS